MPVGLPKPPRNSVAIIQFEIFFFVGSGKPRGEAPCSKEVEQQYSDNLVETFENVGAAAREGGAFKLRELQHKGGLIPGIFSTSWIACASKKAWQSPGADPRGKVLKAQGHVQSIDLA